jgi:hypothetical protein
MITFDDIRNNKDRIIQIAAYRGASHIRILDPLPGVKRDQRVILIFWLILNLDEVLLLCWFDSGFTRIFRL